MTTMQGRHFLLSPEMLELLARWSRYGDGRLTASPRRLNPALPGRSASTVMNAQYLDGIVGDQVK
jgi:hypothetical protein